MPLLSKKYLNELAQKKHLNTDHIVSDKSFNSVEKGDKYDIFLSYSFTDKRFALIIYALLIESGFSVYIDIKDDVLDRNNVNKKTAQRLASEMNRCRSLLYVHTPSSKVSKWCPWELGYMSGKTNFRCAVIPLINDQEKYQEQEYLKLYPVVDYQTESKTKKFTFWANIFSEDKYIELNEFINGKNPYKH